MELDYTLIVTLATLAFSKAWIESFVSSKVCKAMDVCQLREVGMVLQQKCPVPSDMTQYAMCGLKEEVSNDTCLLADDETRCPDPIPQPVLCKYLGNATSCAVCLTSVQSGSCGGLLTFSLFAVTGSGLAVLHNAPDILYSDHKFAVKGDFLQNLFLLKELVTGAISTFVVVVNFLVHFDRRRFLQNRELRRRFLQLIHHLWILLAEILVPLVAQAIVAVTTSVNGCRHVCISLYVVSRRLVKKLLNCHLWNLLSSIIYCLAILCGLRLPCGCWRWKLKRPQKVEDTCCCSPGNLRRSVLVHSMDVPEIYIS